MECSKAQVKDHAEFYERNRADFLEKGPVTKSIENIKEDSNRCLPLIYDVNSLDGLARVRDELREVSPGSYVQDRFHFTIDCHRYRKGPELPGNINDMSLIEQENILITDEEYYTYDRLLREMIRAEPYFEGEVRNLSLSFDGLAAEVYFDDQRMIDFTTRLGERVRREVPTMDFQWSFVKRKVPSRVVNLSRFTGNEDKQKVLEYVDSNRDRPLGEFYLIVPRLVVSDHYLQEDKTIDLGTYIFKH